jgi:hypothetical protein
MAKVSTIYQRTWKICRTTASSPPPGHTFSSTKGAVPTDHTRSATRHHPFLFTDIRGSTRLLDDWARVYHLLAEHQILCHPTRKEMDARGCDFVTFTRAGHLSSSAAKARLGHWLWTTIQVVWVAGEPALLHRLCGVDVHQTAMAGSWRAGAAVKPVTMSWDCLQDHQRSGQTPSQRYEIPTLIYQW